jgi:hypothetical protein
MGQLEKLFELMLKDKKILVNPSKCVKKMKSLIMFDVGGCELDCLPQGMGRLEKLSHLDLSNNK